MAADDAYAKLSTEGVLAKARNLDVLSSERIVSLLVDEERNSAGAVRRAKVRIAAAADVVADALRAGGRLVYVGAGTSGRLAALDAAECPPTFGTRSSRVVAIVAGGTRALSRSVEGAEDDSEDARAQIRKRRVDAKDVVIAISASGVTPFALAALDEARRRGARTVFVTCTNVTPKCAQIVIGLEVGAEVLAGSTRLKAGTATKLCLNAISTCAMVRLGKCYGPRMVDVVASNAKLRSRARRMVIALTGTSPSSADTLLKLAGGHVKIAVVMSRLDITRRDAERLLTAAGGQLRALLGAP